MRLNLKFGAVAAVIATAALVAPAAASAAPAAQAAPASCTTTAWQTLTVGGVQWVRNSDNFGGGTACLNAADGALDYHVDSQGTAGTSPLTVLAYPNLSVGCSFPGTGQYCTTTGDPFPKKVSATTAATITWSISDTGGSASDVWDAGTDDWFEAGTGTTCPATYTAPKTEIMVWPNEQGQTVPARAVAVTIASRNYDRWTNTITSQGHTWTEVIYQRVPLANTLTTAAIGSIYANAVAAGYLANTDCQVLASAGHEILKGGADLATVSLSRVF